MLFFRHLSIKLSKEERLYAAMIRKAYDAGQINSEIVIKLCNLIQQGDIVSSNNEKKAFLSILGLPNLDASHKKEISTVVASNPNEEVLVTENIPTEEVLNDTERFFHTL